MPTDRSTDPHAVHTTAMVLPLKGIQNEAAYSSQCESNSAWPSPSLYVAGRNPQQSILLYQVAPSLVLIKSWTQLQALSSPDPSARVCSILPRRWLLSAWRAAPLFLYWNIEDHIGRLERDEISLGTVDRNYDEKLLQLLLLAVCPSRHGIPYAERDGKDL